MLEVKEINVFHGRVQTIWDLSLEVVDNELVALVGSNGAGKTTIVETISGLNKLRKGSIFFKDKAIEGLPTHKIVQLGIILAPEEKGIFPGMSVMENLELGAYNHLIRKQKHHFFEMVYSLFPVLRVKGKQIAGTLSGGERSMLSIGRALMAKPRLLMLDEPSLGLAPLIIKKIFMTIDQIRQSGVSILLVEQNVHAALQVATRAYIVENGHIVGHGEAKSLINDKKVIEAYLSGI
jgi:branched-chain amino acid transport system ATP-binding protein